MPHGAKAALAIGLGAFFVGCGEAPATPVAGDGELVLEVGGDHPSLRGALVARGFAVAEANVLAPAAESSAPSQSSPVAPPRTSADSPVLPVESGDGTATQPEVVAPLPDWTIVKLPAGETLIHVARRHLGDGRRYLEVMQWNGWTEADARRLATGEPIRLRTSELVDRR